MPNSKVKKPAGTVTLTKGNCRYVYATKEKIYLKDRKYNSNKRVCIGKMIDDEYMIPNGNFNDYFPEAEVEMESARMSDAVKVGLTFVVDAIFKRLNLDELLSNIYMEDASLMKDIICYMLSTENSVMQYFDSYSFEHFLYSNRKYDDTTISRMLGSLEKEDHELFLKAWNTMNRNEGILISYDSTNINSSARGIDMVEYGHAKVDVGLPQINVGAGYDQKNGTPLFYEIYPGSIIDNTECEYMVERCRRYGYEKIGFLLDRGYFSVKNIKYFEENGYEYLLMAKGNAKFVKKAMEEVSMKLRINNHKYYLSEHGVYGTKVNGKVYEKGKECFFHVYYDDERGAQERKVFLDRLVSIEKRLDKKVEEKLNRSEDLREYEKYHSLKYDDNGYFKGWKRKEKTIDKELNDMGYFIIVSSNEEDTEKALETYRNRDTIEKLFRTMKSELGLSSFRVHSDEAMESKMLLIFVAGIIRNEMYMKLREVSKKEKDRKHYTVPAAIKELEKIFVVKNDKENYYKKYGLTTKQKNILKGFELTEGQLNKYIQGLK